MSQVCVCVCVRFEMEEMKGGKKMKILCLHGFRTSGSFLRKQISKWDPNSIFSHFEMEFPDGIFPSGGKSEIEGIFPPPYFEWFQYNEEFTEYTNLEECISYLVDYITSKGPFDGLLGFSQGATISALLLGYMEQGKILKEHPPMKLFVSISGAKFRDPNICSVAYKDVIKVKSVHFIGDKDWLKLPSQDLTTAFENPLIIRHPQGHTVPRLDEAAVGTLKTWARGIALSYSQSTLGGVPVNEDSFKHVHNENSKESEKAEEEPKAEKTPEKEPKAEKNPEKEPKAEKTPEKEPKAEKTPEKEPKGEKPEEEPTSLKTIQKFQ